MLTRFTTFYRMDTNTRKATCIFDRDMYRRVFILLLLAVSAGSSVSLASSQDVFLPSEAIVDSSIIEPCPLRDEGEGEGEGEPELALAVESERSVGRYLRHVLPLLAAALIVALAFPPTRRLLGDKRVTAILAICAVLAVGTWIVFGRSPDDRFVNGWEFFHYYLGSKYAPELGYTGLYAAALVADEETGREFRHEKDAIRNLEDGGCIPVDEVLAARESVVSRFSPERWAAFTGDVRFFKDKLSATRWHGVFRDKGYNATPVWTMFAAQLTSRVPTSSPVGLFGLSLLDPLLLILAAVAVWRTFGIRAALLMVVLIGTHMTMSHSHMKGALLRTDWVVALVLAVCAVKARRPVVGGALVALSAALRIFPAFFVVGLVLSLAHRGPERKERLRFGAAFVVALGVLVTLSALVTPPGTWTGFAEKIWQHHDSFSPWRVGFKHLFLGAYEYLPDGSHQEVFHERRALWWAVQALMLGGLAFITRRLKSWEILALGFVPTFFLVAPTYYYYIMLVIPLLFFCGRIPRPECTLGAAWLLASSSIAYVVQDAVGRELPLFFVLSLIVLSMVALMSASAWREGRARPSPVLAGERILPEAWQGVPAVAGCETQASRSMLSGHGEQGQGIPHYRAGRMGDPGRQGRE